MDSNIFKEALADAKAVKQTALANAKAVLEEAFNSRFEAMLAPKLEEDSAETPVVPQSAPVNAPAPAEASLEEEDVVNEADIDEIIRELEAELPQDEEGGQSPAMGQVPPSPEMGQVPAPAPAPVVPPAPSPEMGQSPAPAPAPSPEMGQAPAPAQEPAPESDDEVDEEINIDELLESLMDDEKDEDEDDKDELDENAPVKSSGIGSSDNKEPSSDAHNSSHLESAGTDKTGGYESGPSDPTDAKRPNQGKNATKTNLSTPSLKKESVETGVPGGSVESKDPTEADRPNQADHATKTDLSTPTLKKENTDLKNQLQEAVETVKFLKKELNEVNVLNAKLLYTNKLFKEFSLDKNQKMKIIEMFDLTKDVREVKLTYATLAESLNFGGNFRKAKVQNITEGMASKPVAGTAPSKKIISESANSEMIAKFQKLAGIKRQTVE